LFSLYYLLRYSAVQPYWSASQGSAFKLLLVPWRKLL
jgi:hypothetical protein